MPLPRARSFGHWLTEPPVRSVSDVTAWSVEPSPSLLMEALSQSSTPYSGFPAVDDLWLLLPVSSCSGGSHYDELSPAAP
jgi:hypothetical protein